MGKNQSRQKKWWQEEEQKKMGQGARFQPVE
jgi:hypothetical protein